MIILLAGVSCVGKTTVGQQLAALLGYSFRDLDQEIENFFNKPLERLHSDFLTGYSFRQKAAPVLGRLLADQTLQQCVIALPPSGLMDHYCHVIKKNKCIVVALTAAPEDILDRITFFDVDSKPIHKQLSPAEKAHHLNEIRKDIAYFGRTFKKAAMTVDITGLGVKASAQKLLAMLEPDLAAAPALKQKASE